VGRYRGLFCVTELVRERLGPLGKLVAAEQHDRVAVRSADGQLADDVPVFVDLLHDGLDDELVGTEAHAVSRP
jgi:hypothetical protein